MDFKKGLLILLLFLLLCVSLGAVSAADADVDVSDVDSVSVIDNVDVVNENIDDISVQSVSASKRNVSENISNVAANKYKVTVSNVRGKEGNFVKITAKVTNNGNAVTSGKVTFWLWLIKSNPYYTASVNNGQASVTIKLPAITEKDVSEICYEECEATYNDSLASTKFNVSVTKDSSVPTPIKTTKSYSKISCKSFTTYNGVRFTCYAYVKNKYTGKNLNGGTVTFKIAGKTYKRTVKNGVAKVTFTVKGKIKKYTCKATYSGKSNVYGSSKTFYMTIKPKPIVVTFKVKNYYATVVKKVKGYKITIDTWDSYAMGRLCAVSVQKGGIYYKPYVKYYYKYKGKTKVTKWITRDLISHPAYARWSISKKAKYIKVKVKITGARCY